MLTRGLMTSTYRVLDFIDDDESIGMILINFIMGIILLICCEL